MKDNINIITLYGTIRDIEYSHSIGDVEYYQANLIVNRVGDKEDIIKLKFKKLSNPYKDGDNISLIGNIRSYSHVVDGKNRCEIYVFTYFDKPDDLMDEYHEKHSTSNFGRVAGRICKIEPIRTTTNGKHNIRIVLANNISSGDSGKNLNVYLPCIAWGNMAKAICKLRVGDDVVIDGEIHSREYKKRLSDDEFEIRVAHEYMITYFGECSDDI